MRALLQKVYSSIERQIESQMSFDVQMSGSTLVMCIVGPTFIVTANCGDSKCIVLGKDGSLMLETVDHKPERPDER